MSSGKKKEVADAREQFQGGGAADELEGLYAENDFAVEDQSKVERVFVPLLVAAAGSALLTVDHRPCEQTLPQGGGAPSPCRATTRSVLLSAPRSTCLRVLVDW